MSKSWVYALLIIALFTGCRGGDHEFESDTALTDFLLDDTDYSKVLHIGDTEVRATMIPADLLISHEFSNQSVTDAAVAARRKQYAPYMYVKLSFTRSGKDWLKNSTTDFQEYSHLLQTLSFGFGPYVSLISNSDTLQLADCVYQRDYGMSGSTDLLLAFSRQEQTVAQELQLNVKEFGSGLGNLRFIFPSSILTNQLTIHFQTTTL